MSTGERSRETNPSTRHVLEILRLVCSSAEPLGVMDISRHLSLPTSTTHRALVTLEESGYLERHQGSTRYRMGMRPLVLGRAFLNGIPIVAAASNTLQRIASQTGETANLFIRIGDQSVLALAVRGESETYSPSRIGQRRALHDGLGSITMLEFMPRQEASRYLSELEKRDPKAAVALKRAPSNLTVQAKSSRFVLWPDPGSPGWAAVGLPLRSKTGDVFGSITVGGPLFRLGDSAADPRLARIEAIVAALEGQIDRSPALAENPFHVWAFPTR